MQIKKNRWCLSYFINLFTRKSLIKNRVASIKHAAPHISSVMGAPIFDETVPTSKLPTGAVSAITKIGMAIICKGIAIHYSSSFSCINYIFAHFFKCCHKFF